MRRWVLNICFYEREYIAVHKYFCKLQGKQQLIVFTMMMRWMLMYSVDWLQTTAKWRQVKNLLIQHILQVVDYGWWQRPALLISVASFSFITLQYVYVTTVDTGHNFPITGRRYINAWWVFQVEGLIVNLLIIGLFTQCCR